MIKLKRVEWSTLGKKLNFITESFSMIVVTIFPQRKWPEVAREKFSDKNIQTYNSFSLLGWTVAIQVIGDGLWMDFLLRGWGVVWGWGRMGVVGLGFGMEEMLGGSIVKDVRLDLKGTLESKTGWVGSRVLEWKKFCEAEMLKLFKLNLKGI